GGYADAVIIPNSTAELSEFLRSSYDKGQKVTIAGAGTGNTGGRIPFGGVVLSTEALDSIISIKKNVQGGYVLTQAGVTVKHLKEEVLKQDLFYPYDPTEQTAFIGGTVSTNASGARSFKYGSTRQCVSSLQIVLARGDILNIRRGETFEKNGYLNFSSDKYCYSIKISDIISPITNKNSAGYYCKKGMDLIDLFIGHEGTLGCVTEVGLSVVNKPFGILSCFSFFSKEEDALNFAKSARELSCINRKTDKDINALAIEFFDENAMEILKEADPNISQKAKACIFFEQDYSEDHEDIIIEKWIELLNKNNVNEKDIWVAMTEKDRLELIEKRHMIAETMAEYARRSGKPKVATDIAVPYDKFKEMYEYYKKIFFEIDIKGILFGHIGDAHLHMNLLPRTDEEYELAKSIAMDFIKKAISLGGTVSAEHGIGKMRKTYLKLMYGQNGIDQMIAVKKSLDPKMILGVGNIFDITG
ncbi:MAG: FAD-binding oxidoreductase, partial [Candidatus Omnitrophica bacterium]|nr:FAD-binding oxidoreductase [Candidatus Omnitrophota bacterium]